MVIKSYAELERALNKVMEQALEEISYEIASILRNNLQRLWYDAMPVSTYYERTEQLIEAINQSMPTMIGKQVNVQVFFDTNVIQSMQKTNEGQFNRHMSLDGSDTWNGAPINELILTWIEKGQSSRVHSYSGVGFFQKTIKDISAGRSLSTDKMAAKIINQVKDVFRRHGFKIIR